MATDDDNINIIRQLFAEEVQRRLEIRTAGLKEQIEKEIQAELFAVVTYRTCMVEGCIVKHSARGYCKKHYQAIWVKGNKKK